MRIRRAAAGWCIVGLAAGCGGQVQTGSQPAGADAGSEAGPVECAGEPCPAGAICKYETQALDATPCCGKCVSFDAAAPDAWTCHEAEEHCRIGCLAAEWPYVWCMIE